MKILIVACLALVAAPGYGAKILAFFPYPVKSHQNVYKPIVKELASKGHHVTFYSPAVVDNPPPTLKQITLKVELDPFKRNEFFQQFMEGNMFLMTVAMYEMGVMYGERIYSLPEVQDLIHTDEKFDLILMNSICMMESASSLQHKFKVPAVDVLQLGDYIWMNEMTGGPWTPSYIVDFKSPFTNRMGFWERLYNTYVSALMVGFGHLYLNTKTQWQADEYFNYTGWEERPRISNLVTNKSLVLVNSHWTTNHPVPLAPNVKQIGGINIDKTKPLPNDIQTFMDGATDGVIYFSLGSNIPISVFLGNETIQAFINTFSRLKQRVLMKWDREEMPGRPPNVYISEWFPQQDILAHKGTRLFITHGGYLSQVESVNSGVPLIGFPFFGDQQKNLNHVVAAGYGLQLSLNNLTEASISWAIAEVLNNPKYKKEAMRRSRMYRDSKWSPREEAVYWIEYVLKHGDVLQSSAKELYWFQLYMLDIAVVLFLAFTATTTVIGLLCKGLGMICCRRKAKTDGSGRSTKMKHD